MGSESGRSARGIAPTRATGAQELVLVGANHRTCALDERERLLSRVTYARLARGARRSTRWEDVVLLTTCNRIEAYALTRSPRETVDVLVAAFGAAPPSVYMLRGPEAAAHLFRVASGLDSLAQGESQVTAQVRRAPSERPDAGRRSTLLADLFERAARAAPRIRSAAGLSDTDASASHAALRFLETSVPLSRPTIALLGTGKMARIAAASLGAGARILVANRDPLRARDVAKSLGGKGVGFDRLDEVLVAADVVLAATASRKPIVSAARLRRVLARRGGRPLWLVDLGFPRNFEPACGRAPGVTLADLDSLAPWGARPLPPAALARAEARIRDEARRAVAGLGPSHGDDIANLRRAFEAVRRSEVEEALDRLPDLTEADRAVVDKLAARLANRFLHGPTEHLRSLPDDARAQLVQAWMRGLGGAVR